MASHGWLPLRAGDDTHATWQGDSPLSYRAVKWKPGWVLSRQLALAVALLMLAVGCSSTGSVGMSSARNTQVEQALKERSQTAYLFKSDGSARFHITSNTEPEPGWYVVKLKLDDVETEQGTVVLQQSSSGGQLNVVAGPGTAFPNQCASSVFPAAVHKRLCGS